MLNPDPTPIVYRDPLCHVTTPGHRCRRRDGRLLTNPYDGDCFEQARADSIRQHPSAPQQPRERSVPCRVCGRDTWEPSAICGYACWDLFHYYQGPERLDYDFDFGKWSFQ